MTRILIIKRRGKITAFHINGHAKAGKKGEDIVCAALSAVVWATINGVRNLCGERAFVCVESGNVVFRLNSVKGKKRKPIRTQVLLDSFHQFVLELAKQHPKNIKVIGVDKNDF